MQSAFLKLFKMEKAWGKAFFPEEWVVQDIHSAGERS